jgi:uncharacterized membrane protein
MTIASRISIAVLSLACAATSAYAYLSLPNWQVPILLFALALLALVLVLAKRPIGYSIGQLCLFLMLIVAILFIIGDFEAPNPQPLTRYPYLFLGLFCAAFIAIAAVLRKAQTEMVGSKGQEA